MVTIKAYTDLNQSCKLAEILPLESADMCYTLSEDNSMYMINFGKPRGFFNKTQIAWSLAALLDVLPNKLQIALAINDFQGDRKEKYAIGSVEHDKYDCFADNSVDACYEIILKLHELKML